MEDYDELYNLNYLDESVNDSEETTNFESPEINTLEESTSYDKEDSNLELERLSEEEIQKILDRGDELKNKIFAKNPENDNSAYEVLVKLYNLLNPVIRADNS